MTSLNATPLETVLNHPDARRVTSDVNRETIERRSFSPRRIKVFARPYTCLHPAPEYRFSVNREARRVLPDLVDNPVQRIVPEDHPEKNVSASFALRRNIGVVFSGGPAPGGHNVIAGLYDEMRRYHPESRLYGFLDGPDGIIESRYLEITPSLVDTYRNLGGFSMIKTGRTKIDSRQKMDAALKTCLDLKLEALVVIGGDDSNTNAAFLAQHFKIHGIQVVGVPKTIDGDIQVRTEGGEILCAISFGFHTAARAFAQNISHLTVDSGSTVKYWHVCKVMGRVASHLALECAFQTHANLTLIGEELADYMDMNRILRAEEKGSVDYTAYGMTLRHLSRIICEAIVRRAASGKNYGVMIIPEGILEFINEIQVFIIKLNKIIADYNYIHDLSFHSSFPVLSDKLEYLRRLARGMADKGRVPIWNLRDDDLFNQLPAFFQEGLLVERDTHGNFQFSQVNTETIILDMVKEYLHVLKEQGRYKIGIDPDYFRSVMEGAGLNPEQVAKAVFKDSNQACLLVKESIISLKTLKQALVSNGLISGDDPVPPAIVRIYRKSEPRFRTQTHFYGYDGRGADPTHFDCNYAYNLGVVAFHLIAGGATGQMAAVRNLEKKFDEWEPIGIPIAQLMHFEERTGKMALVIEKTIVDVSSNAFRVFEALRENWLAADTLPDRYRRPGPVRFSEETQEDRPIILLLNAIGSGGGSTTG